MEALLGVLFVVIIIVINLGKAAAKNKSSSSRTSQPAFLNQVKAAGSVQKPAASQPAATTARHMHSPEYADGRRKSGRTEPWKLTEAQRRGKAAVSERADMPDCAERIRCSANPELPDARWFIRKNPNDAEDPWNWRR